MSKVMLISIKPEFAEKIFNGEKSIELRKATPSVEPGDMVIVYCTLPVKAVIGYCRVEKILKMAPQQLWLEHQSRLGIDEKRFQEYYRNVNTAVGISLREICRLNDDISLDTIKQRFPRFSPPQTFRYYDNQVFEQYLDLQGKEREQSCA
ncbi:ASCH domain-containing protein [Chitinophaga filiformis]|uniref:ASCH domain-containing protein n=1 Tax=Chitinophaga filiformis TaxID=104663 RepID=UPI001F1EA1EC|nr:ASCH domain-containing protein [Chitinophaga filiformis]MCF6402568.1 ASCH domain-containing protein [Chitinophaga filiformis]MCF6403514.1 ASCH domain-containing protein [Chitinophaga filiformis]